MHQTKYCTGGAVTRFEVPTHAKITHKWQVTLKGRNTGSVILKVVAFRGDVDEPVTGGIVDLTTSSRTRMFDGKVDEIVIDDTGNTGDFTAEITAIK